MAAILGSRIKPAAEPDRLPIALVAPGLDLDWRLAQGRFATRLYGREREMALVQDLIDRAGSSGSSFVVTGEAGIGKSSLLTEAAARARDHGMLVLATAGAQSETRLPFAALHQLLRPVLDGISQLVPLQRAALTSAFGLADPVAPNPFILGLAVLELITAAATRSPVFVLVDEAQWLDSSSGDALAFAARRVEAEPVVMSFGVRDGLSNPLEGAGLFELHLEGLDSESAAALLEANSPGLSPRTRTRVLENAAGNPLALLELPTAVGLEGTNVVKPLPLSERLEGAFGQQVSGFGQPLRTLLLLAAIDPGGTVAEIIQAASVIEGTTLSVDSFRPAEAARVIVIEEQTVRFRHPLLRSAVYQAANEDERRQAHRALAELLEKDPDRRAWHRAEAAIGRDECCALDLVAAAARAQGRGAIAVAEAALERAAFLSEDPRLRGARLLEAARLGFEIGNREALIQRLIKAVDPVDLDPAHRVLFAWFQDVFGLSWSGAERIESFLEVADEAVALGASRMALQLHSAIQLRYWWSNPDGRDARPRGGLAGPAGCFAR